MERVGEMPVEWNDAVSFLSKTAFLSRTYTFCVLSIVLHHLSSARLRLPEGYIRLEARI